MDQGRVRAPSATGRATLVHLAVGLALVAVTTACGSTSGCQGCSSTEIPGGFPQQHRFDNAMQVRLSQTGFDFLEQNLEELIKVLVPSGLSFTIPPTGCSGSGSQKICCSGPACSVTMDITSAQITPTPQSTAKLALRAKVKTGATIKFEQKVLVTWIGCDVTFDTAASGKTDLGLNADIDLVIQSNNNNKLKISRGSTSLVDFDSGDIDISGGTPVVCTVIDWLKTLFMTQIKNALMKTVDDTLDAMLADLPAGQEKRFDLASVMASFSPTTSGQMDYLLWAGGYAAAESNGMSLGVLGGFRPAKYSACVPNCEVSGAKCSAPTLTTIARSNSFSGNTRPDSKTFDVGIGVHRQTLEQAAYAMYASGGLCLDLSTRTISQLSSSIFALLVPSLNTLTASNNVPLKLAVRPRRPFKVELDEGTYKKDSSGKVVIIKPLLRIKAQDFAIDLHVLVDERFIRVFTIVGDLEVPVLLFPDSNGDLQPVIGDLTSALTKVKIENNELITEDPQNLAKLFPTLVGLASGFMSSGLQPIELPAVQGLELQLDSGSITTVESNTVMAIFANLGLVKSTSGPYDGAPATAETRASVEAVEVPPTEAFRLGPAFDPFAGPSVTVRATATVPPLHAGQGVEYTYRVDGGLLRPWVDGPLLVVRDPVLWLQGRHTVEVYARVQGAPSTLDPTPARVSFVIDTVPPKVRLVPTADGVRAEVSDVGTPASEVELSWSVAGGAFGAWGSERAMRVGPGTEVSVRARDAAGHQTVALLEGGVSIEEAEEGGCALVPGSGQLAGAGLWLLGLLWALGLRRRRR